MTNKLTADKARERITRLTAWRDQRGLTLREEEYLEAMELALKILVAKDMDKENCPYSDIYGGSLDSFINGYNYALEELKA